jgi:hypothetical protein
MELRVRKICQTSSGGSHVTIFEADVDLVVGDVRVEIAKTDPPDADPRDVELARQAIHRGAMEVLQPRGLGAIIRVRRLVIHLTDFKPWRFARHTAEELHRMVDNVAGNNQ